jgi:tetratricopeptide (TPR) repeat protein
LRAVWRYGRWILLIGLIALNAWRYVQATRPMMDLKAIETLIDKGQSDQAEAPLKQRLERSPHDGEARALKARIYAQREETLACALELQKIPSWWPTKAKWLHMEGTAFKKNWRMREAESAWLAVVKDDPLHPVETRLVLSATLELLELFAVEGRWGEAARLIWNVYDRIDDAQQKEALLVMRMRTEMERITPAVAAEKLEGYLAADPQDWEARRALAKVKVTLGKSGEGKSLLEQCLQQRPLDGRGWSDYLAILRDLGDLDELRASIRQLPSEIADEPEVIKYRALLLERDRQWDQASALYHRLLEARPWEREACYHLALVEERLQHAEVGRDYHARAERMRLARTELNDAFQKVLDQRRDSPESPETYEAIRCLAETCRQLAWFRDANGWADLATPESSSAQEFFLSRSRSP